jgi:hypothetical protein
VRTNDVHRFHTYRPGKELRKFFTQIMTAKEVTAIPRGGAGLLQARVFEPDDLPWYSVFLSGIIMGTSLSREATG